MAGLLVLPVVFSAHAEVVPPEPFCPGFCKGILRARGGSSAYKTPVVTIGQYSPRTRR